MELSPNTPRQRNRRTDRAAAQEQTQAPSVPVVQRVQTNYQQQPVVQPAQAVYPHQGTYQQPAQPVRPTSYAPSHPPYVNNGYVSAPPAPSQQVQQPTAANHRPRALNQPVPVHSGWQQPTLQPGQAPQARSGSALQRSQAQQKTKASSASEPKASSARRLPGWLTTAVSLSIILVLALGAAYWLMEAYLVTQENARIAAHNAVLNNYHITEASDGTLHITWQDEIEYYAAKYNLQPAFVAAIIRTESSFRTNAESNVGARGLMQMMPDTAEWIADKLDDSSYTFDKMYDAETNIRYGCWYLNYLCRLFRGDAELVSAAYHAGQTTITQWLSDPDKSSDGLTLDLDKLSDGPTKQYIGRVTQAYGIYQSLLYPDAAFGAADAVSAGSADAAAHQ